ncbi:MAG: hypothetical protein JXR83_16960 [Deltaproteobacteria bacterium]|nr:hypothetical protein [Deltaproteobacteria bacterium]
MARAGYLAGYLVPNGMRLQHLIDREQPFAVAPRRVLDLGAGPLSATIGLLLSTAGHQVREVVALDTCEKAMRDGTAVLREIAPQVEVTLVTASAVGRRARLPDGPFQAVLIANLLSEIKGSRESIARHVREMVVASVQRCSGDGCVLLLEPGTRVAARNLMQVRDEIDPATTAILAPCTGADRCPLLGRNAWCHASHPVNVPGPIARLRCAAGLTGLELSYSYLALAPQPRPVTRDRARLISDVMADRKRRLRYVCTADGLATLEWTDGDAVGDLALARRGDSVPRSLARAWMSPPPRTGRDRGQRGPATRGRRR